MKILGINGIRSDGSENTDQMLIRLKQYGHEVIDCDYRETRLFRMQTYSISRQYGDALYIGKKYIPADAFQSCAVVAHSRGALVAWRMLEIGYRFKAMFLFRPAMNRDFILPIGQKHVHCIHRPDDRAIKLTRVLPFNYMGSAGRFGLDDAGVINIQAPHYLNDETWRHSDDFLVPQIGTWAGWIDSVLQQLQNGGPHPWPVFPNIAVAA